MDGVLIIDKPAGMTSHDVVARVRRIVANQGWSTGTLTRSPQVNRYVGRADAMAHFEQRVKE